MSSPDQTIRDELSTFLIWRRLTYLPSGKLPTGLDGATKIELVGPWPLPHNPTSHRAVLDGDHQPPKSHICRAACCNIHTRPKRPRQFNHLAVVESPMPVAAERAFQAKEAELCFRWGTQRRHLADVPIRHERGFHLD